MAFLRIEAIYFQLVGGTAFALFSDPPERINRERITQAFVVRHGLLLQVNRHTVTFVLLRSLK
jgi:hypothetical protein